MKKGWHLIAVWYLGLQLSFFLWAQLYWGLIANLVYWATTMWAILASRRLMEKGEIDIQIPIADNQFIAGAAAFTMWNIGMYYFDSWLVWMLPAVLTSIGVFAISYWFLLPSETTEERLKEFDADIETLEVEGIEKCLITKL